MHQRIRSAMSVLSAGAAAHLVSMGVSKADFARLTGDTPWLAADRSGVRNTMDSVMFAAMDYIGTPRFEIPAEYVAAGIVMFVAPCNRLTACRWMESGRTASELSMNPTSGAAPMSAQQLFALCLEADGDYISEFVVKFEKKVKMAIEHAVEQTVTPA